jgi:hypothetical protein
MTASVWTTKRQAVADALQTALETTEARWVAYPSPADVLSLPACVIGPDEPYRQPLNLGQQGQEMRLVIHLFVNRATGPHALDIFDEATDAIIGALDDITYSVAWSALRLTGEVAVGQEPALGASLQFSVL